MIPDEQIRREIAYLDEPEAYTTREEFLAAVLVRSPQALRDILDPCETCQAFEQELRQQESMNRALAALLCVVSVALVAAIAWAVRA